ncbi:MAG: hypothetical protein HQ591_11440 [candidate division Zixibacteria bacterium]|nr:hypothetical protein [Candidatus Tariuqbacter arcticus]
MDDLRFIVVAMEGAREEGSEVLKRGVNDYVVRPFTPDILRNKLIQLFTVKSKRR